jgi:4-hydroxy-tetrahydrodipicolinate synthase
MFGSDGELDEQATAEHLDRLVREGAHGVVVGGTSGEFVALTERERERLIEVAVRTVNGRVPVIAGTGWFSTAQTVALTRFAAEAGADGAIVIVPYYQRPTLAEVVRHYEEVGARSPIPVMIYNNPANSAAPAIPAGAVAKLHAAGHAQAIKSTFPTVHQVHELRTACPDTLRVFYGSFMAPLEGFAGGAHGWISGILNVALPDAVRLYEAVALDGDLERGRAVWQRILPIKRLYTEQVLGPAGDLVIYRGMLRLWGLPAGTARAPLIDLDATQLRTLEAYLAEHGLEGAPAPDSGVRA